MLISNKFQCYCCCCSAGPSNTFDISSYFRPDRNKDGKAPVERCISSEVGLLALFMCEKRPNFEYLWLQEGRWDIFELLLFGCNLAIFDTRGTFSVSTLGSSK